jgi:c-di-GMP-binding flagellar brake protein YcgR
VRPDFLEADGSMFFFGNAKKATSPKSAAAPEPASDARPPGQKRSAYRAQVEFPVFYGASDRPGVRAAYGNDLSAGGMRLVTDEDLPIGTQCRFRFTLPHERVRDVLVEKEIEIASSFGPAKKKKAMVPPAPFPEITCHGKIVITFFNVNRRRFMHGVQFTELDEHPSEEIRRFIHLWQLLKLRDRR